jgi:hypothetical protein
MTAGAEKPHAAVRHFETVAHRAIAQKPRGHRLVMKGAGHVRPQVANTRREQNLGRTKFHRMRADAESPTFRHHAVRPVPDDPYTE